MSEDEDPIVFHNDHVEHDMNDGPDENEKTEAESKGIESTSTETTPYVAVETAGVTGEEHSDRSTVNEEADHTVVDHHARCIHPVVEAGSIVLHVSNSTSEGKKQTVKKQARQQQQKRLKEIRRLIEEKRRTPKEEKQRLKEVSKCKKKSIRDKKNETTARHPKNTRRVQRCKKHRWNQICKEESAHHKDKE